MKNVYLLSTDKPTGIFKSGNNLLFSIMNKVRINNEGFHIYITNDEDVKEDYVFAYGVIIKVMMFDVETLYFVNGTKAKREDCKKIILTTDPDLIKDGIQPIDDEFLEWFVKNPNCESVEVSTYHVKGDISGKLHYKIIIPIEEPKQETLTYTEAAKKDERILNSNMLKQETLLQIANRKLMSNDWLKGAEFGAKWQAERMYSKEEAKAIWNAGQEYWKTSGASVTFEELTEQF
jgi:hypothetical protein